MYRLQCMWVAGVKPEQQTVPLVYRFTIAQAFSVVKPFELLFFRKNAIFLDFFRPLSLHTLGFYPAEFYLRYYFCKISNIFDFTRKLFHTKPFTSFTCLALFDWLPRFVKKNSARPSSSFILPFTCFLRVFPIFYLLFCRPYYFFQNATISAFPLPFLPFSNYN